MAESDQKVGDMTRLELAELLDERFRIAIAERQNSNLGILMQRVNGLCEDYAKLCDKLDKHVANERDAYNEIKQLYEQQHGTVERLMKEYVRLTADRIAEPV